MRKRFLAGLVLLAATFAISTPLTAQTSDPTIGTWKLNVAKSKYDPANLAPKSQSVKVEAIADGGLKFTADSVDSEGKAGHSVLTTMFDGKPSDVTGATDAKTTRVYKRIDARTYEFVQSVAGKVTTTTRTVISADGKTRTNTTTGKNTQGQTVHNVAVYDKQ